MLVSFQINEQDVFEYAFSSNDIKCALVQRFVHISKCSLKSYMYKELSNSSTGWHSSANKPLLYAENGYSHIEALFCPLCPPPPPREKVGKPVHFCPEWHLSPYTLDQSLDYPIPDHTGPSILPTRYVCPYT